MKTDPVLFEILSTNLISITDEIGYTIKRIAHSLFIREAEDFSSALVTPDGKVFAYPSKVGVSLFVDQDCGAAIRTVPDVGPGDIIITNHPYLSEGMATHLPDLHFLVPYFFDGMLVCYGWLFAHFSDVGGRIPGSVSPSSTDLFQEGLQIPPIKLRRGGEFVRDVLTMLSVNARTPDSNIGDIRALIAASDMAQRRIGEIIDRYGIDTFMQVQNDLLEYSELRARAVLRRIPDGTYPFWDYLDDDYACNIPVRLRASMTVRDGEIEIDYAGTDPETPGAYNIASCGKRHHWLTLQLLSFIVTQDPTIPRNSGMFEMIRLHAPSGTILNSEPPASVGLRAATATRVADVMLGTLHKAVPELVPAAGCGTVIPIVISEPSSNMHPQRVLVVQWCNGGTGGRFGLDGVDGRGGTPANMSNNPIETVEDSASLVIEEYALRPDSGGPGRWRGGVGIQITFRVLRDGCQILARNSDRFRFAPWGVKGGRYSVHTRTLLNRGRPDEREVGKIDMLSLKAGETLTFETPGGGGYGDPFEREPKAVLRDVSLGLVSLDNARTDYGVVIVDGRVDLEATNALRLQRGRNPYGEDSICLDPERVAWERICDDELMNRFSDALGRLPARERWAVRRDIFLSACPELGDRNIIFRNMVPDAASRRAKLLESMEKIQ